MRRAEVCAFAPMVANAAVPCMRDRITVMSVCFACGPIGQGRGSVVVYHDTGRHTDKHTIRTTNVGRAGGTTQNNTQVRSTAKHTGRAP